MQIVEQYTIGKSATVVSEDAVVVTSSYAAVIDGATAKTAYRYPSGETPGQLAAHLLSEAILSLPEGLTVQDAIKKLTDALRQKGVTPENRPTASVVIYSDSRREVWLIGDCQFAKVLSGSSIETITNRKLIDKVLAEWRRDILMSYLSRNLLSMEDLKANDPGRRMIQPFITRQVRYQNREGKFGYCALDGTAVPESGILVFPLDSSVTEIILASDGYPLLYPTLTETEDQLSRLLAEDPLCLGPLLGTKGLRPGNRSFDDRTYLRIRI